MCISVVTRHNAQRHQITVLANMCSYMLMYSTYNLNTGCFQWPSLGCKDYRVIAVTHFRKRLTITPGASGGHCLVAETIV